MMYKRFARQVLLLAAIPVFLGLLTSSVSEGAVVGAVRTRNNGSQVNLTENRRQLDSETSSFVQPDLVTFRAQHRHVAVADAFAPGTQQLTSNLQFGVDIDVVAGANEPWQLDLTSLLRGTVLTRLDRSIFEEEGAAIASIGSFTYSASVPNGQASSGTLLIPQNWQAVGFFSDATQAVTDTRNAALSGVGSQTVKLDFTWESHVDSFSNEASARFGLTHSLDNGPFGEIGRYVEYPTGTNPFDDGYFVDGTIRSAGKIMGVGVPGQAYRIREDDGSGLLIGQTGRAALRSLTTSSSNDVFGVALEYNRTTTFPILYSVNPGTGATTRILSLSLGETTKDVYGVELIGSGPDELWVLNQTEDDEQTLHRVDSNGNSVAKHTLTFNGAPTQFKDLAYDGATNKLYGWDQRHGLMEIDRNNGAVTDNYLFSDGSYIDGITFDPTDGTLYGAGSNSLYRISSNETKTLVGTSNDYPFVGDIVILDESYFKTNLVYLPGTGTLILDPQGRVLDRFELIVSGESFLLDPSLVTLPSGFPTRLDQDEISVSGLDTALPFDIGQVLPPGLTAEEISSQVTFRYSFVGSSELSEGNLLFFVPAPEPSSLALILVGTLALCFLPRVVEVKTLRCAGQRV